MAGVVPTRGGGRAEQGSWGGWTGVDISSCLSPYWTLCAAGREPLSNLGPQGHGRAHTCGRTEPEGCPGGLGARPQPDSRRMNVAMVAGQGLGLENEGNPGCLDEPRSFLEDRKSQEDI